MQRGAMAGICRAPLVEQECGKNTKISYAFRADECPVSRYRSALPERLRAAVLRALRSCEEPQELMFMAGGPPLDVHHVVAARLEGAASSRLLLKTWSVDVHSTWNAAILPRSFHQRHGLHRGCYLESFNRRVRAADGVARRVAERSGDEAGRRLFIDMLRKLGDSIVSGASEPVSASLQRILRESDRDVKDRTPVMDC